MTQETMMTDQPTTITEAPASTEAGQVAPEAQLSRAFSSGQSDTASDPSRMPSVSRLGLATDPESR